MTDPALRFAEQFDAAHGAPVDLPDLNDDEILAIDDRPRLAPSPTLDPATAHESAARGHDLLAQRDDRDGDLAVDLIALTRHWRTTILIAQHSSIAESHTCLYLRDDGYAITETVTADGRHAFTLSRHGAALDAAAIILAPGPTTGNIEPVLISADRWEHDAPDFIADARIISRLDVITNTDGLDPAIEPVSDSHVIYVMPDHTIVMSAQDSTAHLQSMTRAQIRQLVVDLATPAPPR